MQSKKGTGKKSAATKGTMKNTPPFMGGSEGSSKKLPPIGTKKGGKKGSKKSAKK
jgi:hypothetical protein